MITKQPTTVVEYILMALDVSAMEASQISNGNYKNVVVPYDCNLAIENLEHIRKYIVDISEQEIKDRVNNNKGRDVNGIAGELKCYIRSIKPGIPLLIEKVEIESKSNLPFAIKWDRKMPNGWIGSQADWNSTLVPLVNAMVSQIKRREGKEKGVRVFGGCSAFTLYLSGCASLGLDSSLISEDGRLDKAPYDNNLYFCLDGQFPPVAGFALSRRYAGIIEIENLNWQSMSSNVIVKSSDKLLKAELDDYFSKIPRATYQKAKETQNKREYIQELYKEAVIHLLSLGYKDGEIDFTLEIK